MTKNELLWELQQSITASEKQALADRDAGLVIGKYNRRSMADLLAMEDAGNQAVDTDKLTRLRESLQSYLDRYMEQKEGHKWVILACVYNAFILEIPLHPAEVTKVKTVQRGNHTEYYCPCRDTSEGSVCFFCVCRAYENETP